MSEFTVHQAKYENGQLQEVLLLCRDEPEPPMFFYDEIVLPVGDVVHYLKNGDTFYAQWGAVCFPVEVKRLPSGEETIEVVQRGQPLNCRSLADLPCFEETFSD